MQDKEFNDLLEDLKGVGLLGPLSRFGSDLDNVVESPGKYKNGANAFFDPVTGARYISHANGYVRRYIEVKYWRSGDTLVSRYCLNQRQPKQEMIQGDRKWTSGVFVLLPNEEDRLKLISKAIRNYRNH
jgi:hypothetical protein